MRTMATRTVILLLVPRDGLAQDSVAPLPVPAASAQGVATGFDQLRDSNRIQPGYSVFVTDRTGRRTKATVVDLTGTTLTVRDGRSMRMLDETQVDRLEHRDSIENGVLLGLGAGLATTWAWCRIEAKERGEFCYRAAYFSLPIIGAGVWIGGALDAALRKTVFVAPGRSGSNRVAITPSLSSVAWGAHLTLSW
jgi:hypothetical protein